MNHFCLNCGAEISSDAAFCVKCGTPVQQRKRCLKCGADILPSSLFCRKCGTAVTPQRPSSFASAAVQKKCSQCGAERAPASSYCIMCGAPSSFIAPQATDRQSATMDALPYAHQEYTGQQLTEAGYPVYAAQAYPPQYGSGSQQPYPSPVVPPKRSKGKVAAAIGVGFLALVLLTVFVIRPLILQRTGSESKESEDAPNSLVDVGNYSIKEPDAASIVQTESWGSLPANQIGIVLAEGLGSDHAEQIAEQIGAVLVGEIELINMYQLESDGQSEDDLLVLLEAAAAMPGVEIAAPNIPIFSLNATVIQGEHCSPLHDPMYHEGNNGRAYEMIGLQDAWDIIRSSGVELHATKVGVIDNVIYEKSGHEFSSELHLPDKDGKYPVNKVRTTPLDKSRDLSAIAQANDAGKLQLGGLGHGTSVAHVIAADPGGGAAGVAGVLGSNLEMLVSVHGSGVTAVPVTPAAPSPEDGGIAVTDLPNPTVWQGYSYGMLERMLEQVEKGATVVNLSWGPAKSGPENAGQSAMMSNFLEIMHKRYPKVVFVGAAGNTNQALDGNNDLWGKNLPNLITVGALNNDGGQAKADDWADPSLIEESYQQYLANGSLQPGTTKEQFIDMVLLGSNVAGEGGEITLSACGTGVPVGLTPDGKTVTVNGTSFAAPQVVGAIALIRSINPNLSAEEIKALLVATAAREVKHGDATNTVPENMGAGVLRVDEAVLKVINDLRAGAPDDPGYPKLPPLTRERLLGTSRVDLQATGEGKNYTLIAKIPAALGAGCDLKIEANGQHSMTGATVQTVSVGGEATWKITLMEEEVFVRVSRLDNEACANLTLKPQGVVAGEISLEELAGTWRGTTMLEEATVSLSTAEFGNEIAYPRSLSALYRPELILQLNEDGSGTATLGGYDIPVQYAGGSFVVSAASHSNQDIIWIYGMAVPQRQNGAIKINLSFSIHFWIPNYSMSDVIGGKLDPTKHYDTIYCNYYWDGIKQ